MAKKYKLPNVLPKRIAGMKAPKSVRRAARSPLGVAIIAQATVVAGREVLVNPQVREAIADARNAVARAAYSAMQRVKDAGAQAERSSDSGRRRRNLETATTH